MKNKILLLLIPLFAYSDSLKDLLVDAKQNNDLLQAKSYQSQAKERELQSSQNTHYPTFDLGANYVRNDDPQPFSPGTTYSGYAKLSLDIYSGGAKQNTSRQKQNELYASQAAYRANKKSIELEIVQNFFTLKTLQASLKAKQNSAKAVAAQLEKMQIFYEAKLTTSDNVDRLQAAYDSHLYAIESLKFEILSLHKQLELQVGRKISSLEDAKFLKADTIEKETLESLEILKYQKNALHYASETVESAYYPQIRLEDTYTLFGYKDKPFFGTQAIEMLKKQNTLLLTLNMRLFDFGVLQNAKEALTYEAKALESELLHRSKEQAINQELALERIQSAKLSILSAQSTLKASKSALDTITQKHTHKLVDNIVYLDALSAHTQAQATYHQAKNNLEMAYALYYFYNGKNLEEYLDE